MDVHHLGGAAVLEYNMSHRFWIEIYGLIDELEDDPNLQAKTNMKSLLDILLMTYAQAEARFSPDETYKGEQLFEDLRTFWGTYLRNYVDTWNEEREE